MTKEEALRALRGKKRVWFFRDDRPVIGLIIDRLGDNDFLVRPIDQFNNPGDFVLPIEEINLVRVVDRKKTRDRTITNAFKKLFGSFSPARFL